MVPVERGSGRQLGGIEERGTMISIYYMFHILYEESVFKKLDKSQPKKILLM